MAGRRNRAGQDGRGLTTIFDAPAHSAGWGMSRLKCCWRGWHSVVVACLQQANLPASPSSLCWHFLLLTPSLPPSVQYRFYYCHSPCPTMMWFCRWFDVPSRPRADSFVSSLPLFLFFFFILPIQTLISPSCISSSAAAFVSFILYPFIWIAFAFS